MMSCGLLTHPLTYTHMRKGLTHRQLTEKILGELLDLKGYVYTKVATKAELYAVKDELVNHIDGLYKRTDTLDHETTSQRSRTDRLEGRITNVEQRLGMA